MATLNATSIHNAIESEDFQLLMSLLSQIEDGNKHLLNEYDEKGRTPLLLAVEKGGIRSSFSFFFLGEGNFVPRM